MSPSAHTDEHLTTGQAAQQLGVSRSALLRAVRRGTIQPSHRTPAGHLRFRRHDIEAHAAGKAADSGRDARPRPTAQSHLAAIVESTDDAIISRTLDGTILTWNSGAERLYGYTAAEVVGRPVTLLIPPEATDEWEAITVRMARGERIAHYETVRLHRDGRRVPISLSVSPLYNRHGRITGVVAIAHDIRERERARLAEELARLRAEQAEEATRRAQAAEELARLRNDFLGAVSHELRTPLAAILGYAELLKAHWQRFEDSQRLERLDRILLAAERQQRLVADLLLATQADGGTLRCEPSRFVLHPILQRVREEIQGTYRGQLVVLRGPRDLEVHADPRRTLQMVANLIDNAAKYSPEGSPVEVSWGRDGAMVVLRVRDRGPGIPEGERTRLFTRFGRVANSKTRAGRTGTGLGLYLSRLLAEAMQGDLDLEEAGAGGSVFRLRLPAADARDE